MKDFRSCSAKYDCNTQLFRYCYRSSKFCQQLFSRKAMTNSIQPNRTLDEVDWLLLAGHTFYASERQDDQPSLLSLSLARSSNVTTSSADVDSTRCRNSSDDIDELMIDSVGLNRATLAKFAPRCMSRSELEFEWMYYTMNENDETFERTRRLVNARFTVRNGQYTSIAMRVRSYGISRTWNLLRHVYVELDDVEIHSGMTEDESRQIVYTTRDYFGAGRIEGYLSLCRVCTSNFIVDIRRKTDKFFLPFNNCDTIVPFVMQTPTIWFGALGAVIGTMLSVRTQNFFTFALFVPFITFCLTAFYNSRVLNAEDRAECELIRCVHVANATVDQTHR